MLITRLLLLLLLQLLRLMLLVREVWIIDVWLLLLTLALFLFLYDSFPRRYGALRAQTVLYRNSRLTRAALGSRLKQELSILPFLLRLMILILVVPHIDQSAAVSLLHTTTVIPFPLLLLHDSGIRLYLWLILIVVY